MPQRIIDKRYKILKKIGAGATGNVYKVRDLKDNKVIALKILSKNKTSSGAVQRFKREFRLLTGLRHPNLCSVYDFGVLKNGRSYFTMEYVDGPTIFEFTKKLPYEKIYSVRKNISNGVYPLIIQLCRVLEYIHAKGLIHYDIKPGNVLIQKAGDNGDEAVVKLMDFGLAGEQRIKGGALIRGTFPYIAPEVLKGLAVDNRADLYSLGVLLYEIFTKKSFGEGKESFATLLKQRIDLVTRLPSEIVAQMPKKSQRLLLRLLAFEPASRFSHANEVIREINKFTGTKFALETEKTLEGYLLSSRFVGRDKEMESLKLLFDQAQHGESKVILITGEAGIGKSRLLKEFKIFTQLERSHCFVGHAYKDKTNPLEPFYYIFKELLNYIGDAAYLSRSGEIKTSLAVLFKMFPDLTGGHLKKKLPRLVSLAPEQEKLRNFEALSELVRYSASSLGELVILLEDLHWADDLTIQFLEYLGRNLTGRNIFICGTCRKEELAQNVMLKKMVSNLRGEGCFDQIELRPLKYRSLYSFLDSTITPASNSSELARYLVRKTGGNPFFVEEIMRTLLQKRGVIIGERMEVEDFKHISIPETIEEVILKRIEDLDKGARTVVKLAAILLRCFTYTGMKELTHLNDTELSNALWVLKRRQVLVEEGNIYRFYHASLSEVLNKRLNNREKRELNYHVGKTLEIINKKHLERVIEDMAHYFIKAKDRKKGIRYGLRAARKSRERYANEQAIRFYKCVLGLLLGQNLKLRSNVLQELAETEVIAGYYDDAIKQYNKLLNLTRKIEKKIKICTRIGDLYNSTGESNKALQTYRRVLRFVRKMGRGKQKTLLEVDVNVRICRTYQMMGDYKRASKFHFDDMRLLKGLKDKDAMRLQGRIYHSLGIVESINGDHDKAIFYYQKAYRYYKKIKSEDKIVPVLNNLGIVYRIKSDIRSAFTCYQKAVRVSEKIGDYYGISINLINLGDLLRNRGLHSKGLDYFQRAHTFSKKIGNPSMMAASYLGLGECFLQFCNYQKAQKHIEKALKIFHSIGWKERSVYASHCIGNIYQVMGDYGSAMRMYRKALKLSKAIGHHHGTALLFIDIGSLFIEFGEFSRAKKYIDEALKIVSKSDSSELKELELECCRYLCLINVIKRNYVIGYKYFKKGIKIVEKLNFRKKLLQFFLLLSDINYLENKYSKGIEIADKTIKMAKEMKTKDLYVEALLMKAKNQIKQDVSSIEILKILDEAEKIAEGLACPEVLWKIYFESGRFFQENAEYFKALKYYEQCNRLFENVIRKISNESYKVSYLNRLDRQAVATALNKIERSLD